LGEKPGVLTLGSIAFQNSATYAHGLDVSLVAEGDEIWRFERCVIFELVSTRVYVCLMRPNRRPIGFLVWFSGFLSGHFEMDFLEIIYPLIVGFRGCGDRRGWSKNYGLCLLGYMGSLSARKGMMKRRGGVGVCMYAKKAKINKQLVEWRIKMVRHAVPSVRWFNKQREPNQSAHYKCRHAQGGERLGSEDSGTRKVTELREKNGANVANEVLFTGQAKHQGHNLSCTNNLSHS